MNRKCLHCAKPLEASRDGASFCSLTCFHANRAACARLPESIRQRHDKHVDVTPGCWTWRGLTTSKGYGRMGKGYIWRHLGRAELAP